MTDKQVWKWAIRYARALALVAGCAALGLLLAKIVQAVAS